MPMSIQNFKNNMAPESTSDKWGMAGKAMQGLAGNPDELAKQLARLGPPPQINMGHPAQGAGAELAGGPAPMLQAPAPQQLMLPPRAPAPPMAQGPGVGSALIGGY